MYNLLDILMQILLSITNLKSLHFLIYLPLNCGRKTVLFIATSHSQLTVNLQPENSGAK